MHSIQSMINGMSADWQRSRAESQMTLGSLIVRLEAMPPDQEVFGIGDPMSYRGYYEDLAFDPESRCTVAEALEICRECMGKVFSGYKGGDFQMGERTPVWSAEYGSSGRKIKAVRDDGTLETAEDDD